VLKDLWVITTPDQLDLVVILDRVWRVDLDLRTLDLQDFLEVKVLRVLKVTRVQPHLKV
jgi:hypothetical protein